MAAAHDTPMGDPTRLSEIYDEAVTEVYRYLRARCGSVALAEELVTHFYVVQKLM